ERDTLSGRLLNVEKVDVRALRRFRTQVDDGGGVFHRAHERLEHEIELARFADGALHAARGTLGLRRARRALERGIVRAKTALAVLAFDERVDEAADVATRFPHLGMHEDGRVEPLDVVPEAYHVAPPAVLQVALELYAEGPVVPDGRRAAVDLGRLIDESSPLGKRDEFFKDIGAWGHRTKIGSPAVQFRYPARHSAWHPAAASCRVSARRSCPHDTGHSR